MKILVVGDPHGSEKINKISLKGMDYVLITGDLGKADFARKRFFENKERQKKGLPDLDYTSKDEKQSSMQIYNSSMKVLKYFSKNLPVYTIMGNVWSTDSWIKKSEKEHGIKLPYLNRDLRKMKNVNQVKNVVRKIGGLKIGFLEYFIDNCWIKEFNEKNKKSIKNAKKETLKAKRILNNFKSLDILICHQPPYGYLDKVNFPGVPKGWKGKHAGSKTILNYIKKYSPKYVFCGHIHEGEGKTKIGKSEIYNLGVAGHKVLEFPKKP